MIRCDDALDELCDKVGTEKALAALEGSMRWTVVSSQASEKKALRERVDIGATLAAGAGDLWVDIVEDHEDTDRLRDWVAGKLADAREGPSWEWTWVESRRDPETGEERPGEPVVTPDMGLPWSGKGIKVAVSDMLDRKVEEDYRDVRDWALDDICEETLRALGDPDVDEDELRDALTDRFGLYVDTRAEELLGNMEFHVSIMLGRDESSERHLTLAVNEFLLGKADGTETGEFRRPAEGADATVFDWLCEQQGTSIEKCVNAPETFFEQSMRESLEEYNGDCPMLCAMGRMGADEYLTCVADQNWDDGPSSEDPEDIGTVTLEASKNYHLGIYDPVGGAGSVGFLHLDRDLELDLSMTRLAMEEHAAKGERWAGYWTPEGCCGFCEPFPERIGFTPGSKLWAKQPHEMRDLQELLPSVTLVERDENEPQAEDGVER